MDTSNTNDDLGKRRRQKAEAEIFGLLGELRHVQERVSSPSESSRKQPYFGGESGTFEEMERD